MDAGHRAIGGIGRGTPVQSANPGSVPGGGYGSTFGQDQTSFGNALGSKNESTAFAGGFGNNQDRGRGSSDGCHKCGESGHFARECPNSGGKRGCYKCGIDGHMAKDCPGRTENNASDGGFGSGSLLRGTGNASSSGQGFGGGGGRDTRTCNKCGEVGHISKNCANSGGGGGGFGGGGFATNDFGGGDEHESRPGGGGRGRGCFNCGEDGHMSKECPNPRKPRGEGGNFGGGSGGAFGFSGTGFGNGDGGGFGGGAEDGARAGGRSRGCFNCGEEGHMSKDCPQPRKERGPITCRRCNEEGHMAKDCPNPPAEGAEDRKPAATHVPEEESVDKLWEQHIVAGINFERYYDIPVEVTGIDSDQLSVQRFTEAQLSPQILSNLEKAGFSKPTPIQQYAMRWITRGRDLMACAQTGSGKTAAFLLPILSAMAKSDELMAAPPGEKQEPVALIVVPTRELAIQVKDEARKFSAGTMAKVVVAYGGVSMKHQLEVLERGCNILVATPGRLLDLVGKEIVVLSRCSYLVLDEADRMLDMGFEPEIRKLVQSSNMRPKTERQTVMFSATFPVEIQKLAQEFLTDHIFIAIGKVGAANCDIKQEVMNVEQYDKKDKLLELVTTDMEASKDENGAYKKKTVVFVERKRVADLVASVLCQSGVAATSIHGDREQKERELALSKFKTGACPVLVATAVAARGLDIKGVDHVINYDMPQSIDDYVHRIGRTGRVGNPGRATSFFDANTDSKMADDLLKILSDAQQEIPEWFLEQCNQSGGANNLCNTDDQVDNFGTSDAAPKDW